MSLMYHLIDELTGETKSLMVFESFNSFTELKEYITDNIVGLYRHVPGLTSYPNYTNCQSVSQLKQEMEKNNYYDWRLTVNKSDDARIKDRRVLANLTHSRYISIKPVANKRVICTLDNGVSIKVKQLLSDYDKKVILHAVQYRVLQHTAKAVFIHWVGSKGATVTWIPKNYLT